MSFKSIIFAFFCVFSIPAVMIIFALIFLHKPPKKINFIYGYRTSRSMQSQETWDYAHKVMGRYWYRFGLIMLVLSIAVFIFLFFLDPFYFDIVILINTILQCMVMIIPIFFNRTKTQEKIHLHQIRIIDDPYSWRA